MDLNEVMEKLDRYVRCQTYPVAVKLCRSVEEIPMRTRMPGRDLSIKIPICQGMAMARRYGWVIALSKEDQSCPFGALTLGFVPPKSAYLDGSFMESIFPGKKEAAAKTAQSLARLDHGMFKYLLLAPLHRAGFEPDLVVVYGNAAQVARLIQGTLRNRGGALVSSTVGGIACSNIIAKTIREDECQYVVAGAGDRYFALTQDDELIFTIPRSKIELTLKGLMEGHKSGDHRYPTPSFLRFEPLLPEHFYKLMDFLQEKGPGENAESAEQNE
jgi:uncharacterized protein (DUF169 family)